MVGICSEIRFLAAVGFAVVSGVVGIATRPAVVGGGSRGVVADVYITRRVRVSWLAQPSKQPSLGLRR